MEKNLKSAGFDSLDMDGTKAGNLLCDRVAPPGSTKVTLSDTDQWMKVGMVGPKGMKSHNCPENAARERSRVRNLREAFHRLQAALPSVPPDTKLSKLDILVLATNYIAHLTDTLDQSRCFSDQTFSSKAGGFLHPVKKWPMRSLLYCGNMDKWLTGVPAIQETTTASPVTPKRSVNM
ncbi:transcription factor 24 isoform X1 [Sardina pilchardus]|uniref:transcription factor 24 isoform X1 n=1 Tax=Sardina pilchardus TaxID=27697 RepID=UPI002E131F93